MEKLELVDFDQELPEHMNVAVLMEKQPSTHPWADFRYRALGVVVRGSDDEYRVERVFEDGDIEHFLVTGLRITLYEDECESYYHNLMSPEPGCFIIANRPDTDAEMPEPYLVSLSFDEAHAYGEGDEEVYSVPIPPELYQWAEAYVLTYYVAIKKTKRKLKKWHDPQAPGGPSQDEQS
jgi:hypothetical protein